MAGAPEDLHAYSLAPHLWSCAGDMSIQHTHQSSRPGELCSGLPLHRHTSHHEHPALGGCESYIGKPIGTRAVPQFTTGVAKPLTQSEPGKTEHHPPV